MRKTRNYKTRGSALELEAPLCSCRTLDLKIFHRLLQILLVLLGFGSFVLIIPGALLLVLANLAFSQSMNQCTEAAALWLPSDITPVKAVTKWQKEQEVKFAIFSHEKASPTVKLAEGELNFVSRQTGLKLVELDQSRATLPDLLVVVDPSVTDDAATLRELAQKFFESKLSRSFKIDAETWNANVRNISPKCFALNIGINDKENVAFLMVQENETSACIRIGLGETFGVIGARNYYRANGETISEAIIGRALRELYSEPIRSGMTRTDALKQVQEDCRK